MAAFASCRARFGVNADLNITPLVDVMLVLLVIFMLATPAVVNRLAIANGPACVSCPQAEPIRLSIKRTGELYWDGVPTTRLQLQSRLAALGQAPQAPLLEIHLEPDARYALLTDVLATAQNAEVRHISVAPVR